MHFGRILALIGVVVGVVGLFMPGATSDGEELLPPLSAANPDFPDGIPTIWGGLDTWAQVAVVVIIVVVVALALRPPLRSAEDRVSSGITLALGILLMGYAVYKLIDALDSAEELEAAFAKAAAAGAIPAAFTVDAGVGFYVLIAGTALVAIGGLLGLIAASRDSEAAA